MFGNGEISIIAIIGLFLTWVIIMLGVGQLARFYKKFVDANKDSDANMLALNSHLKRIQASLAELSLEQRRLSRLMLESIYLKKAELTGEFEIIEEEIPAEELEPKTPPVMPGITLPPEE